MAVVNRKPMNSLHCCLEHTPSPTLRRFNSWNHEALTQQPLIPTSQLAVGRRRNKGSGHLPGLLATVLALLKVPA